MPESERRQTQWSQSVARSLRGTIYYSSDFEIALDLHVDDGYMTRPAEKMMEVFAHLDGKIVLKVSPIIGVSNSFEHVGALRVMDEEGMWVKEQDKYESSVLTMMQMQDCSPSTSPQLEKQTEPGPLSIRSVHNPLHDEAKAGFASHSEMFEQEAQESQPKGHGDSWSKW